MYTLLSIRYTAAIKGYRLQLFNRLELQAKGIMNFEVEHFVCIYKMYIYVII